MKFIEKIIKKTNNIKYTYPNIITKTTLKNKNWCSMNNLTPEQIEALRAEGFKISEAPFLFEHYIEW